MPFIPGEIVEPASLEPEPASSAEAIYGNPQASWYKVVCYFVNEASRRLTLGKYLPTNIDPKLCTHIVYMNAIVDQHQLTIKSNDYEADIKNKIYQQVTAFKRWNIKVTILVYIDIDANSQSFFGTLAHNKSSRSRFIYNAIRFIRQWNFDGLELFFRHFTPAQHTTWIKPALTTLIKEMRAAFRTKGLLLSASVSTDQTVIADNFYDLRALSANLDWIGVPAFVYHAAWWENHTDHLAPMYPRRGSRDNVQFTIEHMISRGVEPRKLVLGMPAVGFTYTLRNPRRHGLHAPTKGPGKPGKFTRDQGWLAYYEVCHLVQREGWTKVTDHSHTTGPYAYRGDQWVSFDDADMILYKAKWVKKMDLGGAMLWTIDLDDFKDNCDNGTYPLLKAINRVLRGYRDEATVLDANAAATLPSPWDSGVEADESREGGRELAGVMSSVGKCVNSIQMLRAMQGDGVLPDPLAMQLT